MQWIPLPHPIYFHWNQAQRTLTQEWYTEKQARTPAINHHVAEEHNSGGHFNEFNDSYTSPDALLWHNPPWEVPRSGYFVLIETWCIDRAVSEPICSLAQQLLKWALYTSLELWNLVTFVVVISSAQGVNLWWVQSDLGRINTLCWRWSVLWADTTDLLAIERLGQSAIKHADNGNKI